MNNNQEITGDNNVQVGINNGQIIQTKKVKQVTEVLHDASNHITDAQALQIRLKITDIAEMVATNRGNIGSINILNSNIVGVFILLYSFVSQIYLK